jgi:hypothetical protein
MVSAADIEPSYSAAVDRDSIFQIDLFRSIGVEV